ncbi:transposase [Dongia sp.]|uniref:REP-associated tyrosine transposase n=1 Tax=Dongia sp. TaxID=1977262 RepID=UPI0035B4910F
MARLGRFFLRGQPLHVIQRGNNRQPIFFDAEDYRLYLEWLREAAVAHGVKVHAYVLMSNHMHLLASPDSAESLPRLMQAIGRRYVTHINRSQGRTGTLWEGRYRAAPIESDAYLLACQRYIELNPVRARVTRRPGDYPWSSYAAHAEGAADALLSDHPLYLALGKDSAQRRKAYRALFRAALPAATIEDLRRATNGGWALGSERFKARIARAAGRRVAPLPSGRPPRADPNA